MEALIIKNNHLRDTLCSEVKKEVSRLSRLFKRNPCIALIGFGEIPLVQYVLLDFVKTAKAAGFCITTQIKQNEITENELFKSIDQLNENPGIDSILVLQPIPPHLDFFRIINRIAPEKEAEGLHPFNLIPSLAPVNHEKKIDISIAKALETVIHYHRIHLPKDAEWAFLMDDAFIRNPLTGIAIRTGVATLLSVENSLSIISTNSNRIAERCKRADILVVITKKPEIVKASWLKQGVFIIDINANLINETESEADPFVLVPEIKGGVDLAEVKHVAGIIIPTEEGLTKVSCYIVLQNTVAAFREKMAKLKTSKTAVYQKQRDRQQHAILQPVGRYITI